MVQISRIIYWDIYIGVYLCKLKTRFRVICYVLAWLAWANCTCGKAVRQVGRNGEAQDSSPPFHDYGSKIKKSPPSYVRRFFIFVKHFLAKNIILNPIKRFSFVSYFLEFYTPFVLIYWLPWLPSLYEFIFFKKSSIFIFNVIIFFL